MQNLITSASIAVWCMLVSSMERVVLVYGVRMLVSSLERVNLCWYAKSHHISIHCDMVYVGVL